MIHEYIAGICVWFEVGFLGGGFLVGFPSFFLLTASLDLFLHWYELFYGLSQLLWASSYKYIPHSFPPHPSSFLFSGFYTAGEQGRGCSRGDTPPQSQDWLAGWASDPSTKNESSRWWNQKRGRMCYPTNPPNQLLAREKRKGGGQWGNKVVKKFGKIRR